MRAHSVADDPWSALRERQGKLQLELQQEETFRDTDQAYKEKASLEAVEEEVVEEPSREAVDGGWCGGPSPDRLKHAHEPYFGTLHGPQIYTADSPNVRAKQIRLEQGNADTQDELTFEAGIASTRERMQLKQEQIEAEISARRDQVRDEPRTYRTCLNPDDSERGYHAAPQAPELCESASEYTERMLNESGLEASRPTPFPLQTNSPIRERSSLVDVRHKVIQLTHSLHTEYESYGNLA
eukprot:TRINITY_DN24895_c0_g1_i1.p1 TRINITY_DN24895_c0_g1~~TRINITY_DN24895_c0_g1_i1.p1  ORF type:complete len:240 (-),score=64.07 TRINITY_DN24895_c0_g1_i1:196-915(-)